LVVLDSRSPTPDEYRSAAALRSALRRFDRVSEQIARGAGLTPRQYLLLLMIKGAPDGSERSTVTELADLLQLQQSTVTELVGRAEAAGLVWRAPSANDGRVVHLHLTPEGDRVLSAVVAQLGAERRRLGLLIAQLEAPG
jgi:DNA-binding MarR family transcriptional regulator